MKNIPYFQALLGTVILLSGSPQYLCAQKSAGEKTRITIVKIGGTFQSVSNVSMPGGGVSLEQTLGRKWSVNTDLGYTQGSSSKVRYFQDQINHYTQLIVPFTTTVQAWAFEPAIRFYPGHAGNGFFLGLGTALINTQYLDLEIGNNNETYSVRRVNNTIVPKLNLGLNLKLTEAFCMDISGGLGPDFSYDDGGFVFAFLLRAGWRL